MNDLLKAVVAVRRECGAITKHGTNPHFKSTYATLNDVLETVEPIMEKHGIMIIQTVEGRDLITTLHSLISEASVKSTYPLVDSPDPQKFASSVSYARRYSIVTLLGLMTEDDDGNKAASLPAKPAQTVQTAPYKPLIGTNKATPVQPKKAPIIEARSPAAEINRKRDIAAIQAPDFSTFEAGGVDAAQSEEYVCQFGKWNGSTIAAIIEEHGIESLGNYVSYLKKKETKGVVSEFVYHADIVMRDRASFDPNSFNQPMGDFNSDDGKL